MDKETIETLAIAISTEICHRYDKFFSGTEDSIYELVEAVLYEENRKLTIDETKTN